MSEVAYIWLVCNNVKWVWSHFYGLQVFSDCKDNEVWFPVQCVGGRGGLNGKLVTGYRVVIDHTP